MTEATLDCPPQYLTLAQVTAALNQRGIAFATWDGCIFVDRGRRVPILRVEPLPDVPVADGLMYRRSAFAALLDNKTNELGGSL